MTVRTIAVVGSLFLCTHLLLAESFVKPKKKKVSTATLRDQYQSEIARQIKLLNRLTKEAAQLQEIDLEKVEKFLDGDTSEDKVQLEDLVQKYCSLNDQLVCVCDMMERSAVSEKIAQNNQKTA